MGGVVHLVSLGLRRAAWRHALSNFCVLIDLISETA